MKQTEVQKFWKEFHQLWKENWYDGLSTFNKKELLKLLKKYNIEIDVLEYSYKKCGGDDE